MYDAYLFDQSSSQTELLLTLTQPSVIPEVPVSPFLLKPVTFVAEMAIIVVLDSKTIVA